MTIQSSIRTCDIGRDGYVASTGAREGKYVSRFVFAAKAAVQLLQAFIAGDQNIHVARHLCQLLCLPDEALNRRGAYAVDRSFKNHHQSFRKQTGGLSTALPQRILLN